MGMDVAAKGSSMATMNVVPLIDILLVLNHYFHGDHTAHAKGSKCVNPATSDDAKPRTHRQDDCGASIGWLQNDCSRRDANI